LKRTTNQKLIEKYGNPEIEHLWPYNKEGQESISVEGTKPDGFCEEAWTAFGKYAFALAHRAEGFFGLLRLRLGTLPLTAVTTACVQSFSSLNR